MKVYKAFSPGLICRDYTFRAGKRNTTEEANCCHNGLHAAENPMDCLSYYTWDGKNEFWICEAVGDIDEDGVDSKISTTCIKPLKRLSLKEYIAECVSYILRHPNTVGNQHGYITIIRDSGVQSESCHVLLVWGKAPRAEVRHGECLLIMADIRKQTARAKTVGKGFYHIGEDGIESWTENQKSFC